MSEKDHVGLWNDCLEIIRDNVPAQTYKTWFCPIIPLKFEDNTLVLQVPSQFFYEFLEEKFLDLLRQTIHRVFGKEAKLMYNVMVVKNPPTPVPLPPHSGPAMPARTVEKQELPPVPQIAELDSHLNRDYNFDTFIEGESNKLSRSVAEAVALNPAKTIFNPLFFYGASGVGKTHLSNAIGTKIKELYPDKRVLYTSAHLFQQNTFFHIFNHLHQNGKQLILTSDRPPALLQGMEDRLITRFKWGMVAELEKPNVELRRNILLTKIRRDGLQFPSEVVDYIAENVSDSVRDLEGTIISLMAHSIIYKRDVDLELAQRIVRKVTHNENRPVTVDDIINVVCRHFGLDTAAIHTQSRKRDVVQARQVAMYLAKQHTDLSKTKIGALIGGSDHSTDKHSCKTIKEQREVDKGLRAEIDEIQATLKQHA